MRILHIMNDVTDRGNGIVNTAVDLAIEQGRQGHVIAIASAGGGYEPLLERSGVRHFILDQSRRPVQILRSLLLFRRQIHDFKPDVVHAHMRTGLFIAWFWARIHSFALVAHVHNVHDRDSVVMGLAERVIVVSQSVAETMANRGISAKKIRVVLNRTLGSPRQPEIANIQAVTLARPSVVTVGGMNHRKGIAELIAAFEIAGDKFRAANLYLVGDGPERVLFEEQARKSLWRDRIHFEGFQNTPQAYMLSADIFVLASRRESFGLVLIEARQAGCSIVASDIDGIAEALDGGRAGLLVPPQNIPALAEALCRLLASEDERRLWQCSARRGIEAFHVNAMACEVDNVYDEIIHRESWKTFRGSFTKIIR
jgi:glycosyltransferase involved in cell wall biosynthesis